MSTDIQQLIGDSGQVVGQTQWSGPMYTNLIEGEFVVAPTFTGQDLAPASSMDTVISDHVTHERVGPTPTVGEYIDRPVEGNTGPSLDSSPTVEYRADHPGFGGYNDQILKSGATNFSPGVVPSEEVGTGKPPGWVIAHMPVAQGINLPRSAYANQGLFADGQEYFPQLGDQAEVQRQRAETRAPWWPATLIAPGQSPGARVMWPGSGIVEQPSSLSLAQVLGRVTGNVPGWGVQ